MLHTPVIPSPEVEVPFAVYLDNAREQIARTRANSDWLNGTRSHDSELVRALAHMNRDADRAARSRDAAACAAADRSIGRATAPMLAGVGL